MKGKLFDRLMAGILSVAMAVSPVASSVAAYASETPIEAETSISDDEVGIGGISISQEDVSDESQVETTEKEAILTTTSEKSLSIELKSTHGKVVIDDGKSRVEVRLSVDEDGYVTATTTDKDGKVVSQWTLTDKDPYAATLFGIAGNSAYVSAVADEGYVVDEYDSTVELEDGSKKSQDVGFERDRYAEFECEAEFDADRIFAIDFKSLDGEEKASEKDSETTTVEDGIEIETEAAPIEEEVVETPNEETGSEVSNETPNETAVEEESTESVEVESEPENAYPEIEDDGIGIVEIEDESESESEETTKVAETETVEETESEATEIVDTETESDFAVETESETETEVETEPATETELESETETEILSEETETETEEETEHFLDDENEYKFSGDFSSMRLVVMAQDKDAIVDPEHLIGNYGDVWLLQYSSVKQTLSAYAYYKSHVAAVEPDAPAYVADGEAVEDQDLIEENPLAALADVPDAPAASGATIALLDTGVSGRSENVIGRVSLIDDSLSGNGHADAMMEAILSENPNAKVISVRVMDDAGHGTTASIIAGIEYALEQGASIINLSLYSRKTTANSVLIEEIERAIAAGATVVGAAGNSGSDASNYVPGAIGSAWIIGACDEDGIPISTSNVGSTVDLYAVADSTSAAAAMFSGRASLSGVSSFESAGPTFFAPGMTTPEEEETEDVEIESESESESEIETEDVEESDYPEEGESETFYESLWIKDKYYDFASYDGYEDDPAVTAEIVDYEEVDFDSLEVGDVVEFDYSYALKDEPERTWIAPTKFAVVATLAEATVASDEATKMLPSWIPQEGSVLPLPEFAGETIEGLSYKIPKGDSEFSLEMISNGYDVKRFRTWVDDDGGFDVDVVGTYEVTYRTSYFLLPDLEWFVKSEVEVVEPLDGGSYVRNESDTMKVFLDGETAPFGIPTYLNGNSFEIAAKPLGNAMLNEILPVVSIETNGEDVTEEIEISEETVDGTTTFSATLPESDAPYVIRVRDEGNALVYDGKNSYSGNWKSIDAYSIDESEITDEEVEELEALCDSDEFENDDEDPTDDERFLSDDDFIAAATSMSAKTWKQSSSLKLYTFTGMNSGDWNDTFNWYHAVRVHLSSALAAKMKAYVKTACNSIYWSDVLQKKFDAKVDKFVKDNLIRVVCSANAAEHEGAMQLKGWSKSDAQYFLGLTSSNQPTLKLSGKYTKKTVNRVDYHTWKFTMKCVINPNKAAHNGNRHQAFKASRSFTIKTKEDDFPFSATKINADESTPRQLPAYQNLSATFYVGTNPSNVAGSLVADGILQADEDGDCEDAVDGLLLNTQYYCWEDPNSTTNFTAATNPIGFSSAVADEYELAFPNVPVKMGISLQKASTATNITNGNRMYSLAGIPFRIWSANQGTVRTPTTNEAGAWTEAQLWKDNYVVSEIPGGGYGKGYKTNGSTFAVNYENLNAYKTYTVNPVWEEPVYATPGVTLKKETPAAGPIASFAGAVYRFDYYDMVMNTTLPTVLKAQLAANSPKATWSETSAADGTVRCEHSPYTDPNHPENNGKIVPLGTLIITEMSDPTNGKYYRNSLQKMIIIQQNGENATTAYYNIEHNDSFERNDPTQPSESKPSEANSIIGLYPTTAYQQEEADAWGHVIMRKVDWDADEIEYDRNHTNDGDMTGDAEYDGTTFEIYVEDASDGNAHREDNWKSVSYGRDQLIETITVANGIAETTVRLQANYRYYVKEKVVRDGYLKNETVYHFTVRKDAYVDAVTGNTVDPAEFRQRTNWAGKTVRSVNNAQPFKNRPKHGGVKVKKYDLMRDTDLPHGDADLSDARFAIINASTYRARNKDGVLIPTSGLRKDGKVTYQQVKSFMETCMMQELRTNAAGDAQTGNLDLPYGTYYVIETKAPAGYQLNETWVGRVIVRENGKTYDVETVAGSDHDRYNHDYYGDWFDFAEDSYATRDQIYRSGVSIPKIDKEMHSPERQGDGTLLGAEFTIINASLASSRNKDGYDVETAKNLLPANPTWRDVKAVVDRSRDPGQTYGGNAGSGCYVMQRLYTDESGHTKTGRFDLPYGTYYVIETKASYGYYIDENFVGKIVVRDDGLMLTMGDYNQDGTWTVSQDTPAGSGFHDVNDGSSTFASTVDQQVRRSDLKFMKVNADGDWKPYVPFVISAIRMDDDGNETVVESHAVITDENGYFTTQSNAAGFEDGNAGRAHSNHTNELDEYVDWDAMILDEARLIADYGDDWATQVSNWGVWFQGDGVVPASDRAIDENFGALYPGYYRVTEILSSENSELEENLLSSKKPVYVYNSTVDLTSLMTSNARVQTFTPFVDLEIEARSTATDVESGTKTVPARSAVEVKDVVEFEKITVDHKYRLETQFVDVTDGNRELQLLRTDDPDAYLSEDRLWVCKEFTAEPTSHGGNLNTTRTEQFVTAWFNAESLRGHVIQAIDYLYEYVEITDNDAVPGSWILVKTHPNEEDYDYDEQVLAQSLYVPDIHTTARDSLTGDREAAKSESDSVLDRVEYMNLSDHEEYVIVMKVVDRDTGEALTKNGDGTDYEVSSRVLFDRPGTPLSGTVDLPEYPVDSSKFEDSKTAVVIESLYRTDPETKLPIGEPILVHDSLLDEDQTIRWPNVRTTATDEETLDDVGTHGEDRIIYDEVLLENLIFDDDDHDGGYVYKVTGRLVYQKDFTDANGVEHREGETVETLDGTQDVVEIRSDASANATFTYEDGSAARGQILSRAHGYNVGKRVNGGEVDNSYVSDPHALYCNATVRMIYHVNANVLEGGSVVAFEYLWHDATGASTVQLDKHEEINDEGQTVHFPKVRTSAVDDATTDDVGALRKDATITDTVSLTNLIAGREYVVTGVLKDRDTGEDFLVNGRRVVRTATVRATEDGRLLSGNGERTTVTSFNETKHEVCGTVDLIFEFDARGLENRTTVVFEDLYHDAVQVAVHNDLQDNGQTIRFPKIRTTAFEKDMGDRVAAVVGTETLVDRVRYENLVIGRTYVVKGVLMNKKTSEPLVDANGNEVRAERTFVAGTQEDGLTVDARDDEALKVSGTVDVTFEFDASLLEGVTTVAFETLLHNDVEVTTHADIEDRDQTTHWPKVRTSALEGEVGDEVGEDDVTTIVDRVRLWNLLPGKTYVVSGKLMDKDTGEPYLTKEGNEVTQTATITVGENGTLTSSGGERVEVIKYDEYNEYVDGTVDLTFEIDATELEDRTLTVFEKLEHNGKKVAFHEDISDLAQTLHFPKIRTTATDSLTEDEVGTVNGNAIIVDVVHYENLVIGKNYRLEGALYYQDTGKPVVTTDGEEVTSMAEFKTTRTSSGDNEVLSYDDERKIVSGNYTLRFEFPSTLVSGRTTVVFEDLYHNKVRVATHSDITDLGQSTHYPEVRTSAYEVDTKDSVAAVRKEETIIDKVALKNLVPGKEYVVKGTLIEKESGEPLLDDDGNEIKGETTFVAQESDDFEVTYADLSKGQIDGIVEVRFTFDAALLEGKTAVAFEKLIHNGIEVACHEDLEDEEETVYWPKVRTTAIDGRTADEVGTVAETTIVDTVKLWNLVPGMTYVVSGILMDKDAGEVLLVNGEPVTAEATVIVGEQGTLDGGDGEKTTITRRPSEENRSLDGTIDLTFTFDASTLENKTVVVFEDLFHKNVKVATHSELSDLAETIHYPKIRTTATDADTNDHAGTVKKNAVVRDVVKYQNLVIGRTYVIKGTLMNRETGNPILDDEGELVTAEATFVAGEEEEGVNKITKTYEADNEVDGEYVLEFVVDSTKLQGATVVVFEDLYHNDVKVTTHAELEDDEQTVRYPKVRTSAYDVETGDKAGDVTGVLMNAPKRTVGDDSDEVLATITDVVKLENLTPGLTYVVSGKLYDADESRNSGEPVPLLVNGEEIAQTATITVSADGLSITASDGERTEVLGFDGIGTDGTVDLKFTLDSSLVQGVKTVVFEKLYQDSTYVPETDETNEEDLVNEHSDYEDEEQSVSEVKISTTAVDSLTENHVGTVPSTADEVSVIRDSVHMSKLVPGMEYEIRGALVELNASDMENHAPAYFKGDGTLTTNRDEAYEETLTFTAKNDVETHELTFAIPTDKVQGYSLTVFENLYHADVMISSHPSYDEDEKWNEKDFASQTVYYPTGKTNATDDVTQRHASFASGTRTITDRVYFEDLLCGEEYEIVGNLVYKTTFEDAEGVVHEAGEPVATKSVKFEASRALASAAYVDEDGEAPVDGLVSKKLITGETTITGYVSLTFEIDASLLEGATFVAFETFRNSDVDVFVHADLNDLAQTVRIPKLRTTARTQDLDETSVFDEEGNAREIEIIDEVRYENLWTQEELDAMRDSARQVNYLDESQRIGDDLYGVAEDATYVVKGTLMDLDTGEPLTNSQGGIYESVSEPFSPENPDGTIEILFTLDPNDFMDDDGECLLEGKSTIVFEDLYMTDDVDEDKNLTEENRMGEHRDLEDEAQDVRFPKGRTHATDGPEATVPEGSQEDGYESGLATVHENERTTTDHEVLAGETMTITDMVSFSNLHGATQYSVKGTLQLITKYGVDGKPSEWEVAKDDEGNEITAETILDTSEFSTDYDARVSGYVPLVFEFSGLSLRGETLVAFEEVRRDDKLVIAHADIEDAPQTIHAPLIHTDASEAYSGIDETLPADGILIRDVIKYENLENGKTYSIKAEMRDKETGEVIDGSQVEGRFVAGVENQWVTIGGTKIATDEEAKNLLESERSLESAPDAEFGDEKGDFMNRVNGEVSVLIPIDAPDAENRTYVAFENLYAENDAGEEKKVAEHEDLEDEDQDVKFPKIRTKAGLTYENVVDKRLFIKDVVSYWNLTPGREYVMYGELMDKETGESVEVTASTPFVPDQPDGEVEVIFEFDRDEFSRKTLVAFENLRTIDKYGDERTTAKHEDIEDEAQAVPIPWIGTRAFLSGTEELSTENKNMIVDVVAYENLTPGMEYVMHGRLVRRKDLGNGTYEAEETGETAETTFTPEEPYGTVEVKFELPIGKYEGEYLVSYERLTCGPNAKDERTTVAVHEDLNDEAQTVPIPKIRTKAALTGTAELTKNGKQQIVDVVSYENLTPGTEYVMHGRLVEKKELGSGSFEPAETGLVGETTFVPQTTTGTVEVAFELDLDKYAGRSLVAYERLTFGPNEEHPDRATVAIHEDLNDSEQTVPMPKIRTLAKVDGKKETTESSNTEITDEISYENLTPGKTYLAEATMMDKKTGKATSLTGTTKFTPKSESGTVTVSFKGDTSKYAGKSLVAFERVYSENENSEKYVVTVHEDIDDKNQTVSIKERKKDTPVIQTGDPTRFAALLACLAAALALAFAGIFMIRKKRRPVA